MSRSPVLRQARIMPQVLDYHMWSTMIGLICSVVGIILLPVILPLQYFIMGRYYKRLEVVLTRRDLQVRRGIWNLEEKSIPLEKITDLAVFQGPIMRWCGIKGIRVETAGQSTPGALVVVFGIVDVDDFRDQVLAQRDRVSEQEESRDKAATPALRAEDGGQLAMLAEIRDCLQRIEAKLGNGKS